MIRLFEFLWNLLPDRCEMPGCSRRGTRGNENRIEGKVVCDYCSTKLLFPSVTLP